MNHINLCRESTVLKIFKKDAADGSAEYEEYRLDGVRVEERTGSDPDMTKNDAAELYYFHSSSKCTDASGAVVPLPRPGYGDLCIIRPNEKDETVLRVSSVEYRDGVSPTDGVSHVKIILR